MTGLPLKVWPEAEDDFAQATAWYEEQADGLADDLAREIDIALQKIVVNPDLFPIYDKELKIRRILVARFPFKIFFRIESSEIGVCGILHSSQDDWILKQRVKND